MPAANDDASLPVEFTERVVFLMCESGFMLPQLGAVLEFDGRADAEALERAVGRLTEAAPVLACRFDAESAPPRWVPLPSPSDGVPFACSECDGDIFSAADSFICGDYDPTSEAQLSALFLRGADRDALVLRVSHIAADAAAIKDALYALAQMCREPGRAPAPSIGSVRNCVPIAKSSGILEKLRALKPAELFPPTGWGVPGAERRGEPVHVCEDVGADCFRSAAEWARRKGATANDLLLAAYYRALWHSLDPMAGAPTPVQMSCDLRRWLPSPTSAGMANISATWSVSIERLRDEPFQGTLARVAEKTKQWKVSGVAKSAAIGTVLADRLMRRRGMAPLRKQTLAARGRFYGDGKGYPTLTNIGVIDDKRLDFGSGMAVSDAYLLGPVAFPSGFVLAATTFHNRLRLSAGIDRLAIDAGLARQILRLTASEIAAAGSSALA